MPEKAWDEYDWERFLQQQDQKTDRYMELLEQYIDHPDRDEIIAQEMGWPQPVEAGEIDWDDFAESVETSDIPESFERHPLYQASFALTVWIDRMFDGLGDAEPHPAAVKLASHAAVASAKLAAALSDDDKEEIGMTIAYLKRALKAITQALEAAAVFVEECGIGAHRRRQLQTRLFQVRDGIIQLMGESRLEWRRRHGA